MIQFPEGIDATIFLRDYWQQKPLLIRQGLPSFTPPLDADELAGLALEEDIESRIVLEQGQSGPWELRQGPFSEKDFASLPGTPWTLLVQAIDLWVPEAQHILSEFNFLPRWRMDDIMVSYANDGGSVGPHFDYYDVFLIQGQGQREWSIGQRCDDKTPLRDDTHLKIIKQFEATQHWVLEAGDILYLPPCIAHHGVALTECMTFSVGFRAPTLADMLDDLATEISSRTQTSFYRDPPLSPKMAEDKIHPDFIAQAKKLLLDALDDEKLLSEWFAAYMTEPKYPQFRFEDPAVQRKALITGKGFSSHFVDGINQQK